MKKGIIATMLIVSTTAVVATAIYEAFIKPKKYCYIKVRDDEDDVLDYLRRNSAI